jgi:hypothetical protein
MGITLHHFFEILLDRSALIAKPLEWLVMAISILLQANFKLTCVTLSSIILPHVRLILILVQEIAFFVHKLLRRVNLKVGVTVHFLSFGLSLGFIIIFQLQSSSENLSETLEIAIVR